MSSADPGAIVGADPAAMTLHELRTHLRDVRRVVHPDLITRAKTDASLQESTMRGKHPKVANLFKSTLAAQDHVAESQTINEFVNEFSTLAESSDTRVAYTRLSILEKITSVLAAPNMTPTEKLEKTRVVCKSLCDTTGALIDKITTRPGCQEEEKAMCDMLRNWNDDTNDIPKSRVFPPLAAVNAKKEEEIAHRRNAAARGLPNTCQLCGHEISDIAYKSGCPTKSCDGWYHMECLVDAWHKRAEEGELSFMSNSIRPSCPNPTCGISVKSMSFRTINKAKRRRIGNN